eukprot:6185517-Pleurochrysis_carterae.AAC.1
MKGRVDGDVRGADRPRILNYIPTNPPARPPSPLAPARLPTLSPARVHRLPCAARLIPHALSRAQKGPRPSPLLRYLHFVRPHAGVHLPHRDLGRVGRQQRIEKRDLHKEPKRHTLRKSAPRRVSRTFVLLSCAQGCSRAHTDANLHDESIPTFAQTAHARRRRQRVGMRRAYALRKGVVRTSVARTRYARIREVAIRAARRVANARVRRVTHSRAARDALACGA